MESKFVIFSFIITLSFLFPLYNLSPVIAQTESFAPSTISKDSSLTIVNKNNYEKLPGNLKNVKYFYEPYPLAKGESVFQLGGSFSMMPIPIAEQEFPYPALDAQYKYAFENNLCFVSSLSSTLHYSNLLHFGVQWNANTERLSLGVASHFGAAIGYYSDDELFDNVWAYGTFWMPIVRVGYRFTNFSLTLSFVTTYLFKTYSVVNGDTSQPGSDKELNDFYITLAVEQPFLKQQYVSVGFSLAYARTPYQSWMLYNTVNEWLFVPEFFFSVQL